MPRTADVLSFIGFSAMLICGMVFHQQNVKPEAENVETFDPIIAIEFGTALSRVGISKNNSFELIPDEQGRNATPSVVAYTDQGPIVGYEAIEQAISNPKNTIYDIKHLLGRKWSDGRLHDHIKTLDYDVVQDEKLHTSPVVRIQIKHSTKFLSPEEITGQIFRKLKIMAEGHLKKTIENAVITVPAYFNDDQRQATKDAAALSGLNTLRLTTEPTAACMGHGIDRLEFHDGQDEGLIIVYDIGAKASEVMLHSIYRCVFETLANAGDRYFGGEDFERSTDEYLTVQKNNANILRDYKILKVLKKEIKLAEAVLSLESSTDKDIETDRKLGVVHDTIVQTQPQTLKQILAARALWLIEKVLKEAKETKSRVDGIVLTGDRTHTAHIRPILEEYFQGTKFHDDIPSDEAVIRGAAHVSQILSDLEGDGDNGCNLFMDVLPLSLSIETSGGVLTQVVSRNTIVPLRKSRIFSTATDYQSKAIFRIYEGQRPLARHNKLLGVLEHSWIPLAPRGVPQIEVSFEIDPEWQLKVTAVEKKSGIGERVNININSHGESWYEVDPIVIEAEENYESDMVAKDLALKRSRENGHTFGVVAVDR